MPFFRRGGSRSSASATSASATSSSKDDADVWRSSTHCTPSEVASVVSKTSSRRSSRTGALMVTISRPPRPTTAAASSARSEDKSSKDPSPKNNKKKKKERITRTTKPGSSAKSGTKKNKSTNSKSSKSMASSSSAATPATDRNRRGRSMRDRDSNEQGKEGKTSSRSSTPMRRNRRDDENVCSVERDTLPTAISAASPPPSTPIPCADNGNNLTSSSPESTTSTVVSDSSDDSHGNTTVSSITQTMALDPARMAMDYPELAASLKHHPPMIERTLKCPAGAIGCQIDDSSTGPIIDDVLASSSMGGLLFPGDRILAVDGLDVRGLKCGRVTEIMSERRHQEREIKVLSIINIAKNGCKGDTEQPKEGESSGRDRSMEKLRARKKKLTTPAVSSVPAMPTPTKNSKLQPLPLHRRSIVAPAGKLGLVLRNTKDGPAIHTIKPTSPLEGKIFVGDRIVRVNSTDTTTFKAKELTKLMAGNSNNTREIVVLSAVDGAKDEKPKEEVQMKVIQPLTSSTPNPLAAETNKASHIAESISSATASLSTRSDTKESGVTESEATEPPSVSVDHSLPPFRSTPSRRKEGESFQQYLVRRRKDLSDIRAKKECHDDPACADVKSSSSEGNRSSASSFGTMKMSAEKFVQEGNQDAAMHQYERLIGCLEMRYNSDGSQVDSDGDEITKIQQAGAQEEIIALCDVLRELYRAKGEKAKSVKCLRKKISTQRSLLKLKMEMM